MLPHPVVNVGAGLGRRGWVGFVLSPVAVRWRPESQETYSDWDLTNLL